MGASSLKADNANLDLIRAVAVLCVFFGHLIDIVSGRHLDVTWRFAQMGVLIFFVHTSLVLMLSLERSRLTGSRLFTDFYVRRAFRIYPLAMTCVVLSFVSHGFGREWTWRELASNLALTTNLTYTENMVGGLWTLPLEVQMYVVLPVLFVMFRAAPLGFPFLAWITAVCAGIIQPHVSDRLNVLVYSACFMGGVIAWRLSSVFRPRFAGRWWPLAFMATWPVFLFATRDSSMYFAWAFSLVLGLMIPLFAELRSPWLTVPAKIAAKYSYGIYLSHVAVMLTVLELGLPGVQRWALFWIVAATAPVLLFHLIEQPMIQVGRRLARALSEGSIGVTPASLAEWVSPYLFLRRPGPQQTEGPREIVWGETPMLNDRRRSSRRREDPEAPFRTLGRRSRMAT
jgi:peptidoglycan/LPS O-acetylase OafA/YrhL